MARIIKMFISLTLLRLTARIITSTICIFILFTCNRMLYFYIVIINPRADSGDKQYEEMYPTFIKKNSLILSKNRRENLGLKLEIFRKF